MQSKQRTNILEHCSVASNSLSRQESDRVTMTDNVLDTQLFGRWAAQNIPKYYLFSIYKWF